MAHYNFGVVSLQRERLGQARAAFEATFTDNPAHAEALNSLGAIVETSGDLSRAAALFRWAIAANPSLRLAHFHLGRIYAKQKRYPQAIAEFGSILQPVDSETAGFRYALGATEARLGDGVKALQVLVPVRDMAIRQGQSERAQAIAIDVGRNG